jgi:hypothetical protein
LTTRRALIRFVPEDLAVVHRSRKAGLERTTA